MRRTLVGVVAVAIATWGSTETARAQSSTPDTPKFVFDGVVNDVAPTADGAYVGGDFDAQIPAAQGGVFAAADGTGAIAPGAFPSVNGTVATSVADGAGGVFIGGTFTRVGTTARTNLAHVRADGSVDQNWAPTVAFPVLKLVRASARVFVQTSDPARPVPTALSATTGAPDPAFSSPLAGGVTDFDVDGARLYVAGNFATPGGTRIATALDLTTGAVLPWAATPPFAEGTPRAVSIAVTGGVVLLQSGFVATDAQSTVEAYDAGTAKLRWQLGTSRFDSATGIGGYGGRFLVANRYAFGQGGRLRSFDAATGREQWSADTARAFSPSFAFSGGTVYVGGVTLGTGPADASFRHGAAAYDLTTGALRQWRPYIGRPGASTVAVTDGRVFLGGAFSGAGAPVGLVRDVARIHRDGSLDQGFDAQITADPPSAANPYGLTSAVSALALDGGTLFAAGSFDAVGGARRSGLAGLDPASGAPTSLSAAGPIGFSSLAVAAGKVFASNRVYPSTGASAGERVPALDAASTFAVSGSTLYFGASALDARTLTTLPWDPAPTPTQVSPGQSAISSVAVGGDSVFVAGGFTALGALPRRGVGAVDPVSGAAKAWNAEADGAVGTVATDGTRVYAAGPFRRIGGEGRAGVAALDPVTARATGWAPAPDGTVGKVVAGGGRVFLVGKDLSGPGFSRVGTTVTGSFAQFTLPNATADLEAGLAGLLKGLRRSGDGALGSMVVPAAGRVTVGLVVGSTVVSIGTAVTGSAGPIAVPVPLNDVGRLILSVYPAFKFTGIAIYTPDGGGAATVATAQAGVAAAAR